VNFHRRFDPLHQRLVASVLTDPVPLHLDGRYSGSLANSGSHALDFFRWVAGEASVVRAVPIVNREPIAVLSADSGATGTFCQVNTGTTTVFDIELTTRRRRVTLGAVGEQAAESLAGPSGLFQSVQVHRMSGIVDGTGIAPAMHGAVDALVSHLVRGIPLPCTGEDGIAALRLEEAILAATVVSRTV
jgi:predicted dehydrogenase